MITGDDGFKEKWNNFNEGNSVKLFCLPSEKGLL